MADSEFYTSGSGESVGSSLLGGYIGNYYGKTSDAKASGRQVWMASNAHQLEVDDLRAAGLNPILSTTGGSGARFPTAVSTAGSAASSGAQTGAAIGKTNSIERLEAASRIKANQSSSARDLATADATTRASKAEYGEGKTVQIDVGDGKTHYISDTGLKGAMTAADLELVSGRARSQGFENVTKGQEAGIYEKNRWLTPIRMLNEGIRGGANTFKAIKDAERR